MSENDQLTKIAEEVFSLRKEADIFELLSPPKDKSYENLNNLLEEILNDAKNYDTIEIAMYLRSCGNLSDRLSHWKPLLEKGMELGQQRNEDISDIFFGMRD